MFHWQAEFELGITSIDNQHKKLIEIGNRINELLEYQDDEDDYNQILEVLEELKSYTDYHFKTEEELFLKYNYPEFHLHKKEHDNFIRYIDSIDVDSYEEDKTLFIRDLLQKIINWIFHHIITSDYMYKDYLVRLGAK
jgi:hemerythrin